MSALAFLSLDGADAEALARSSMERRLRDAGAEFAERDGWLVAVRVPGEEHRRLLVRDLTHLHRVREGSGGAVIEYRTRRATAVVTRLLWSGSAELLDVSAGYAALAIEGPGAETVLRRMTELDLSDLPAVGAVAHVRAWVIVDGDDSYRLVFEQEYGHYLWEVAVDAAEPLGGGPGGTP